MALLSPTNAGPLTLGALPKKHTDESPVQPEKEAAPIFVTLAGIVTVVKRTHRPNASMPMLVIPGGIVTLVKLMQPSNEKSERNSRPLPIVALPKLVQYSNAASPNKVTLSGMARLIKPVLENAPYPICLTLSPSVAR